MNDIGGLLLFGLFILGVNYPPLGIPLFILLVIIGLTVSPSKPSEPSITKPKPLAPTNNLASFMYMKYRYLQSPEWKSKRAELLDLRPVCECCNSSFNLEIHHLSGYNRIPNELDSDLVVLCRYHHQLWHDKYGYPKTYSDYMNWAHPYSSIKDL